MQLNHDAFAIINDCENAVHEAFRDHSGDPRALTNAIGSLHTDFGSETVGMAMTNCMKVAYLRIYGPKN